MEAEITSEWGSAAGEWLCKVVWPILWKAIAWSIGCFVAGISIRLGFAVAEWLLFLSMLG